MNLHFLSLERWLKNGSLDFARVSACAVGAKANVPLCGGKKLNKKMCGGEKKKYRRVGKVCRLSSCPFVIWSVCLCLSVKMVYASLVCLSVTVRVARSFYACC